METRARTSFVDQSHFGKVFPASRELPLPNIALASGENPARRPANLIVLGFIAAKCAVSFGNPGARFPNCGLQRPTYGDECCVHHPCASPNTWNYGQSPD
jgi:hypothetical protein